MDKQTQLKVVVCGVALVSLSTISPAPASAQPLGSAGCESFISGSATFSGTCVQFAPGPQTWRVDFPGNHSFKVIVNVVQEFFLEIESTTLAPPGPTTRYPDATYTSCIPYVFATSDTVFGDCALYDVRAFDSDGDPIPPDEEDQYFSGQIIYRIAWDFPTLASVFDNPRGLRAETSSDPFFDITAGVFPTLNSGEDPGVDMYADGFSQYIVTHQTHGDAFAGCFSPLNCSDPDDPNLNVFKVGRTIPVKVALSPDTPSADLRLTWTGPLDDPQPTFGIGDAAGNSNTSNMFRRTGKRFEFNWKTTGLAPGEYQLTISPGTNSGNLFAPFVIHVLLQ